MTVARAIARAVARAMVVAIAVTALVMVSLYAAGVDADFGPVEQQQPPVEQPQQSHIKLL
jgi:hypothetical protein